MSASLRPRLAAPYDRGTWTTFLRDLFPDGTVTLLANPAEIAAAHEQITSTRQLGHLQLAEGRVALIEVAAADRCASRSRAWRRSPSPRDSQDQTRLSTLAERAAAFAKPGDKDSLHAPEREIDGIVYRLFSLTLRRRR